jgi:hypothetical protein
MIKKGDKVVCIKNISYTSKIAPNFYIYKYNTGHQYEVETSSPIGYYITTDDIRDKSGIKAESLDRNGLIFFIEEENKFVDYFITLAEWREQQIKTVLDGDE